MKKIILFALAFALLSFTACKKESHDNGIPVGTISVSIGGETTNFTYSGKAVRSSIQEDSVIDISAFKHDPSVSITSLSIRVMRPSAITTGTYIENMANDPIVQLGYIQDFLLTTTQSFSFNSTINPLVVTITSISATSVQGTFKGDIMSIGNSAVTTLTDGKFNIPF